MSLVDCSLGRPLALVINQFWAASIRGTVDVNDVRVQHLRVRLLIMTYSRALAQADSRRTEAILMW